VEVVSATKDLVGWEFQWRFGFSVEEVVRGGRERTVDVSPGMRRTTSF
jgi:hypothetical protein